MAPVGDQTQVNPASSAAGVNLVSVNPRYQVGLVFQGIDLEQDKHRLEILLHRNDGNV